MQLSVFISKGQMEIDYQSRAVLTREGTEKKVDTYLSSISIIAHFGIVVQQTMNKTRR